LRLRRAASACGELARPRLHPGRSIGQVGSAGDNAAIELFIALLQRNVLDRRRWDSHEALRLAIVTSIERTYHRRRR
jgi:transposase InsO family protein